MKAQRENLEEAKEEAISAEKAKAFEEKKTHLLVTGAIEALSDPSHHHLHHAGDHGHGQHRACPKKKA